MTGLSRTRPVDQLPMQVRTGTAGCVRFESPPIVVTRTRSPVASLNNHPRFARPLAAAPVSLRLSVPRPAHRELEVRQIQGRGRVFAARNAAWELIGPPEVRQPLETLFTPWQ